MKKKIQLCALVVLFFTSSFAQIVAVQQKAAGGSLSEHLATSFQTKDGGLIAAGTSKSNMSGEKTEASKGRRDYWIVKYNKDGKIVWDKTFGGDKTEVLANARQTKDGGYILAGTSTSGISGNKTEAGRDAASGGDFWIVKIDKSGNQEWDKTLGGSGGDTLVSIVQTIDEGFIVGGISSSDASSDKSANSRGESDYWVIKLSKTGVVEWDKTFGGTGNERLASVRQTADNGYVVGGTSESGRGKEKTENRYGRTDFWILKLNAAGDVEWDKTIGGSGRELLGCAEQTADGGYIVAGSSNSDISGLKTQKNRGTLSPTFDYWLVKLDADHNIEWDRTFGGDQNDILTSASQTSNKGYVLIGSSTSGKSGEKSEENIGGKDYWFVKTNEHGKNYKDKTLGGTENEFGICASETNNGEFWVGGFSNSGVSGNKTEESRGKTDFWMVYLKNDQMLPVNFTNVKAYQQGTGVKVLWTSLSEINVGRYEIQRSSDAVNFKTVGTITPSSNAAKQVDYNFFDQHPENGGNYYRIKAIDLDGTETMTSTVLVTMKIKEAFIVYPNPVKDILNIQVAGKADLSLVDQNGKVVLTKTVENSGAINVSKLPGGVYYLSNNATGEKVQVLIVN